MADNESKREHNGSTVVCKPPTIHAAKSKGAKVAISTDAHSVNGFQYMRFGIDQARRGWLTADDVINTRWLAELRKLLKR